MDNDEYFKIINKTLVNRFIKDGKKLESLFEFHISCIISLIINSKMPKNLVKPLLTEFEQAIYKNIEEEKPEK